MANKMEKVAIESIIEEMKKNPSTRFSKSDFQTLVYGILADKNFKAKRYVLRNEEITEEEFSIGSGMYRFLDKLLKHAGLTDSSVRQMILEEFEYSPRDLEWVTDAVDEAMWIYTECGKNMRVFREKMLQLTLRKIIRTGKYDGKITYKKSVTDRAASLAKRKLITGK